MLSVGFKNREEHKYQSNKWSKNGSETLRETLRGIFHHVHEGLSIYLAACARGIAKGTGSSLLGRHVTFIRPSIWPRGSSSRQFFPTRVGLHNCSYPSSLTRSETSDGILMIVVMKFICTCLVNPLFGHFYSVKLRLGFFPSLVSTSSFLFLHSTPPQNTMATRVCPHIFKFNRC